MSEQTIVAEQLKKAQAQADAAIKSRALLEEDFNAQSTLLTQFISKLSNVCKGIDLELDNRLAKLRVLLTKSGAFADIEHEIQTISQILNHHAVKNSKHIKETHEQMHSSGKVLQKSKGLPADVRRQLRALLTDNQDHKEALIQYIPRLNDLLDLYGQALSNKASVSSDNANDTALLDNSTNIGELNKDAIDLNVTLANHDVIKEIIRILDDIQLSEKQKEKLKKLKTKLTVDADANTLLDTLLSIFIIVIEDMRTERKVAKSFLSSLSKALSTVQISVNKTITDTNEFQQEQTEINTSLKAQLSELTETVEHTPSLVEAKDDLHQKLGSLADIINQKHQTELSHYSLLTQQLSTMQNKVTTLEQQSKAFEQQLAEQKKKSLRDALTKLHNRAAFDEYFSHRIAKYHNKNFDLAIAVVDLDDFKQINDTFGHTAGDKTLKVVASILKSSLDESFFVARYGGEEFVVISTGVGKDTLFNALDRVRKKICALPLKFKDSKINISASFGATHINPSDNIHTAFERADSGLYQAKEKGKNQVIYL